MTGVNRSEFSSVSGDTHGGSGGILPSFFRAKGGPIILSLTGNAHHKPTFSATQSKLTQTHLNAYTHARAQTTHRLEAPYDCNSDISYTYSYALTTHQAVRDRGNTNTSVGKEITLVCAHACTYVRV